MIADSSIDVLVNWRKEAMSRLAKVREDEVVFRETFKTSANALRRAKYKGKDISWDDQASVLQMLEDILLAVSHIARMRGADLELLLDNIDKLARAELPPGISWEWPSNSESGVEH